MFISIALIFFLVIGAVSAVDNDSVSIKEDSNLDDNVATLSSQDKLGISNEVSISEANIVNSQNDNLGDSSDAVLSNSNSDGNDSEKLQTSISEVDNKDLQSSNDEDTLKAASDDVVSVKSGNVPVDMKVSKVTANSTATVFKVSVKDTETGNGVYGTYKVLLILNGKNYIGTTEEGIANIVTGPLTTGNYNVVLRFAGSTSRYQPAEVTQKVYVYNKVAVILNVTSAVSDNTATNFKVSVIDSETGKGIYGSYQVLLTLNGKKYAGPTVNGVANIVADPLAKGNYTVGLKFAGGSHYEPAEISQTVEVFGKVPVKMTVDSAISNSTGTLFKVSVIDSETGKGVYGSYQVLLILNGKKYAGATVNGVANIVASPLASGTYTVVLKFAGSTSRYAACEVTQKVSVFRKAPVKMKVESAISNSTVGIFKVSVKDSQTGKAVYGTFKVLLVLNGKSYVGTTDSNGVARITTNPTAGGTYNVALKFAGSSRYDATQVTQKVTISKATLTFDSRDAVVKYKNNPKYDVTVKNKNGQKISGVTVKITFNGHSFSAKSNANGVASISLNSFGVGYYTVQVFISDPYYQSATATRHILVNGTKFIGSDLVASAGENVYYSVKVVDGNSKPIKNLKVIFKLNSKSHAVTSDASGIAKVNLGKLSKGTYTITYSQGPSSGSSKITVLNRITLNTVIAASRNVKKFIENNEELPKTVNMDGVSYSTSQYLYVASQAIYNLKSGDKSTLAMKIVNPPASPLVAKSLGNLYDYYTAAKREVDYVNGHGVQPDAINSDVGKIGYDGAVYAFARVLVYYGDNSQMPNYVAIKSISTSFTPDEVNTINTITDLAPYLVATANCQVNNAQIKELAAKLTSGLTSDTAKATAIYNYVRDTISYAFYYDTKYGAVGTLDAKRGNCVDQAHLLNALYRASGLPARYVHGTCTFSDGTFGHVWTQVLIGDVWTVGDPVSPRNSLGSIANWNTHSYSLHGYYASLSF